MNKMKVKKVSYRKALMTPSMKADIDRYLAQKRSETGLILPILMIRLWGENPMIEVNS